MWALPYDWRIGRNNNNVPQRMAATLKLAKKLTGKKSIIMAHSLGNHHTHHSLTLFPQKFKKDHVFAYFAVTPALQGAAKAMQQLLGGAEMLNFGGVYDGVNISDQEHMFGAMGPSVELLPGDAWYRFKDADWMKGIARRLED